MKEERQPEQEYENVFESISFGPESSSSSSSSSVSAAALLTTPIAKRRNGCLQTMSKKEGQVSTGGQAVVGGVREVFNPYTRRTVVFGSGGRDAAAVNPGAQKKRRVSTVVTPATIRDGPEEEDVEFPEPEGFSDIGVSQYDAIVAAREAEEERRKSEARGMGGMDAYDTNDFMASDRSQGEVSVSTTGSVLMEPVHRPCDLHNSFENANRNPYAPIPRVQHVTNVIEPRRVLRPRNPPVEQVEVMRMNDDEGCDLDDIARSIIEGNDGAQFEAGEREAIGVLTSNSTKYCKRIDSVLVRVLRTAAERCGPEIRQLALGFHTYRNGERVPLLMFKISGERHGSKKLVINSIMVQVALSWRLERKNKDKVAGDFPESTTWDQWIKLIQSSFRTYDVRYSLKTDFFGKGEFHGVLEKFYREEKRKNPKFGTGRYASDCPEGIEDLMLEAIERGALDLDDRKQLQMVCYYLLGVRLCLRGGSECHDRVWKEFEFIMEKEEDGVHNYVKLTISDTVAKGMQITVRCKCCCLSLFFIISILTDIHFTSNSWWKGKA